MSKVAFLFLSSKTYPSERNSKIQKKLFLNQKRFKEIYWYKQGTKKQLSGKEANLINNDLFINADDSSIGMGFKTIKAFEWMLDNTDFEILFRTNTSSFISFDNIEKYINENFKILKNIYCGKIYETNDIEKNKIIFASGSGYFLSRDVVEKIVLNKDLWDHRLWDDVSLALLLKKINIKPINGERFDIEGNIFRKEINLEHYHYRCRIDNHFNYPRFLEIYVLKYLDKIHSKKNANKLYKLSFSAFFEICRLLFVNDFGWKIYLKLRYLLKLLLPKKFYEFIKIRFNKKIENFKLVRFKI